MTNPWLLTAAAAAASWALAGTVATAQTPGDGGQTVPDGRGGVWLADMDLPASMPLTVPLCASTASPNCINPNGSMNYQTAQQWIAALKAYKGVGYLGRRDWQLPTTQPVTAGCMSTGPHGESFGYGCAGSALGSLYQSMGLIAPGSAAGPVTGDFEGFDNLQPNLYWTDTIGAAGVFTFSFATGWRGANQGRDTAGKNPVANFFYVLPMLDGDPGVPGVIYDSDSNKSFLADGNIAASNTFGLPTCDGLGDATSAPCVNADGRMTQTSAEAFVQAMKATSYLGQSGWKLPPSTQLDNCHYAVCASPASNNPLASLFYNGLGLSGGSSVAAYYTDDVGPFSNVQPYLYWSCQAASSQGPALRSACSAIPQCTPFSAPPCAADMEWSFNFGDGFQGTDEEANDLFVTAFSPNGKAPPPRRP